MKYKLAGRVVEIEALNEGTLDIMKAYVYEGDEKPAFEFRVTKDEFEIEKEAWVREYSSEIENCLISHRLYSWLLEHDGTYLHANAVEFNGWGYVFTADSGTGKSTHCSLWKQAFGRGRVRVLNDDKPLLYRAPDGVFYVCGSPWCGKVPDNINSQAPLAGICILRQAKENTISRVSPEKAVLRLYEQAYAPDSEAAADKLFDFLEALADNVPVYDLGCDISEAAARLAYGAMRPKEDL